MSGGSWDYLCYKELGDLEYRLEDLDDMSDRLASLGYAKKAAEDTVCFIVKLREIKDFLEDSGIKAAWKEIEWWDSNDSCEEKAREYFENHYKD